MKGALASALRSEDRLQLHHIFQRHKADPPVAPAIGLERTIRWPGRLAGAGEDWRERGLTREKPERVPALSTRERVRGADGGAGHTADLWNYR